MWVLLIVPCLLTTVPGRLITDKNEDHMMMLSLFDLSSARMKDERHGKRSGFDCDSNN